MNRSRFTCLLALIGCTLVTGPSAMAQITYSFRPLAMKPINSVAGAAPKMVGLSPDGAFAAGEHQGQAALEKGGSVLSLGTLPGYSYGRATGVAAYGDAVVGGSESEAFYWTPSTGMIALGVLPSHQYSLASDVSEKGDAVIGYSLSQPAWEGFFWSPSTGMKGMGFLPGHTNSLGTAISGNGKYATGWSWSTGVPRTAFRWESGRLRNLGTLPGYSASGGHGISRFGDFIVGVVSGANSSEGFIWDKSSGMKGIGVMPGYTSSVLKDVSENGTRSVGYVSNGGAGSAAILYDSPSGKTFFLKDLLLAKGVRAVARYELLEGLSISDDGTVIVGLGTDSQGQRIYWQITLP